ncbi:MAG: UbiA family prenyltransferase [Betaproteobacteria bacterium]
MILSDAPIVVDLDGTLLQTDSLHESVLRLVHDRPALAVRIPAWLRQGRAYLKRRIAESVSLEISSLPLNQAFLDWLKSEKATGRRLVLCTAADESIARAVANHVGIFDEVLSSDGRCNLSAKNKADALTARFGEKGFDYAGNSHDDLHVWRAARRAIVVNAPQSVARKAGLLCEVERIFQSQRPSVGTVFTALRLHQWVKNLLLLVAPIAAHQMLSASDAVTMVLAFCAFSLCASAIYIGNDLLDLDSDRAHPRKRMRAFAAGTLPLLTGILLAPGLLAMAFLLASWVNPGFMSWLALYFCLTVAYSMGLKRLLMLDCVLLAALYTIRITAGASVIDLDLSFWLVAFSVFLFLSLAFVKRYAELTAYAAQGDKRAIGRAYRVADLPLVMSIGVASGYAAVVVLAMYLNSDAVVRLYATPEILWCAVLVMIFWISWVWMKAHRGQMDDDPVLFALRDPASLMCGALSALILIGASQGWAW